MTARIPVSAAATLGKQFKQAQVILVTWDADAGVIHVVTWGDSKEACSQAAVGGNVVKQALGWPESFEAHSAGYKALQRQVAELKVQLKQAEAERWNVPS